MPNRVIQNIPHTDMPSPSFMYNELDERVLSVKKSQDNLTLIIKRLLQGR